jgi:hypothetical protein
MVDYNDNWPTFAKSRETVADFFRPCGNFFRKNIFQPIDTKVAVGAGNRELHRNMSAIWENIERLIFGGCFPEKCFRQFLRKPE